MKRRARTVLLVLLSVLAAGLLALFVWLPWNPFESDAGPLDEWVPADVDAVIRFDAGALRRADALATLWDGPTGRLLRDQFDVDAKLDAVKRADAALTDLPFWGDDPPTVERDLLGGEALFALRGGDVVLLTRISPRAKAIDLICRVREERREDWGIRVEGDAYAADVGDGRSAWFARRRDVLIVSTSRELLDAAVALADGRGPRVVALRKGHDVRAPAPSATRITACATGAFVARHVGRPPLVDSLIRGAVERPVRVDIDLSSARAVAVSVRFFAGDAQVSDVAALADEAARLAVLGEAFAVGAAPVSARDAVAALFDSQPPARRRLVDELLAESGSSVDAVVADLARHFADGVGFVVARLPETDRLRLDAADGDPVEPIPATTAVFRLIDADSDALLADLSRHAAALFGGDARVVEAESVRGARLFVPSESSFGPEWAMLRPAFAVAGRTVVFSTNEPFLRRALGGPQRGEFAGASVGRLRLDAALFKRRLDDLRWEVADRATRRDWAAERGAVREDLARRFPASPVTERERREDDEIARRIDERKRRLFPEAVRAYRDSLRWLDGLRSVEARATLDGDAVRIDAEIGLREP